MSITYGIEILYRYLMLHTLRDCPLAGNLDRDLLQTLDIFDAVQERHKELEARFKC